MGLTREKEIEVLLDAGSAGRDLMSHIDSRCPDVWVLIPKRAGDTTQVLALAEALDWPFEVKTFARRKGGLLLAPPFMASLAGIRRSGSSELKGPWPDLVITAGAENEPIARWIRMQSGGRTRIVIVGRAWADASDYDLVVTTPQYRMPRLPNVLHNGLPLHRVTTDRLKRDAALWAPRLANLPRPFITVLVGGTSGPYPFTVESGERLARQASALAKRLGGSLLITTSSRTPKAAVDAMAAAIDVPHVLHSWRQNDPENPYFAFLELGDEIIVTADSVSMMGEACATVKPVHLFDLGEDWTSMRVSLGLAGEPPRERVPVGRALREVGKSAVLFRWAMRNLPSWITRDLRLAHRELIASGRADWLDDPRPLRPAATEDVAYAVATVHELQRTGRIWLNPVRPAAKPAVPSTRPIVIDEGLGLAA